MKNYVYAMFAGDFVKIGITSNIDSRIKQVQTGCPLCIHRVLFIEAESRDNSFNIESNLHKELEVYSTFGEWFLKEATNEEYFKYYFNKSSIIKNRTETKEDKSVELYIRLKKLRRRDRQTLDMYNNLRNATIKTDSKSFTRYPKRFLISELDKEITIILNKHKV